MTKFFKLLVFFAMFIGTLTFTVASGNWVGQTSAELKGIAQMMQVIGLIIGLSLAFIFLAVIEIGESYMENNKPNEKTPKSD